jgi:hypothetical protein
MMLRPAFSAASAARITSMTIKLGMALRAEGGTPCAIIAAAAAIRSAVVSAIGLPLHLRKDWKELGCRPNPALPQPVH